MKINTYAVNCNDAWLNTDGDDISGSYVKYKDHQEVVSALEAKCASLAAENAALNNFIKLIKDDCLIWDDKSEEYFNAADYMPETPATDAFLAEVRVQGVDVAIEHLHKKFDGTGHIVVAAMALESLAAQLRQDANTAELVAAGIITKVGE